MKSTEPRELSGLLEDVADAFLVSLEENRGKLVKSCLDSLLVSTTIKLGGGGPLALVTSASYPGDSDG